MGKKTKKGSKGQATVFMSRKRAMRKLGLNLKDFRRLCILKGVFPRQPNRKLEVAHRTYYHIKDLKYLMSDKLMDYLSDEKIHKRRLTRAIAKKDTLRVKKLRASKPLLNVDHIVKQRYPRFDQALRELSDPLSLLSLVGSFPGHRLYHIPPQKTRAAQLLMNMFKALIVKKRLLCKVFLSVKGIYYEAALGRGIQVVWIEPYQSATVLPVDVDYKMLLTFAEFHQSLLKFVMVRLYSLSKVQFPPKLIKGTQSTTFGEFLLEDLKPESNLENEGNVDEEFKNDETLKKMIEWNTEKNTNLFDGFVFFISREVRKEIFVFLAKTFGAEVLESEDNFDSAKYKSKNITHVISDRNLENIKDREANANREYVQPQWICDSINFNSLLNVRDYLPGKVLPPHLSPFDVVQREGFMPERQKDILKQLGEEEPEYSEVSDIESEEEEEETVPDLKEGDQVEADESQEIVEESDNESDLEEEEDDEEFVPEPEKKTRKKKKKPVETVYTEKLRRNRLNVKKVLDYKVQEEKFDPVVQEKRKRRIAKKGNKEKTQLAVSQLSSKKRKVYEKLEKQKTKQKEETKVLRKRQRKLKAKSKKKN